MLEMLRMIIVLSLLCGLSGFGLASLKDFTEPIIEEQVLSYVQAPALMTALPAHDNDPVKDRKAFEVDGTTVVVFPAMQGGKLVGVALETFAGGYGGPIGIITAFDVTADTIAGIGTTTLKETPGLGMRLVEPAFTEQFRDHALDKINLTANGGKIETIAGATISSNGAVMAVQKAVDTYRALKETLLGTWS